MTYLLLIYVCFFLWSVIVLIYCYLLAIMFLFCVLIIPLFFMIASLFLLMFPLRSLFVLCVPCFLLMCPSFSFIFLKFCSENRLEQSSNCPGMFRETSRKIPNNIQVFPRNVKDIFGERPEKSEEIVFKDVHRISSWKQMFPEISRKLKNMHVREMSWKFPGNFLESSG